MASVSGKWVSRDDIKFWLLVLGVVVSISASWIRTEARVDAVCDRLARVEARLTVMDPTLTNIQVTLAELQTDIQWVRTALAQLGEKVSEQ